MTNDGELSQSQMVPNDKSEKKRRKSKKASRWKKTSMPSKKKISNGFILTKDDIYYLKQHTRYDEKEIRSVKFDANIQF